VRGWGRLDVEVVDVLLGAGEGRDCGRNPPGSIMLLSIGK
jgi:hypothetical protein